MDAHIDKEIIDDINQEGGVGKGELLTEVERTIGKTQSMARSVRERFFRGKNIQKTALSLPNKVPSVSSTKQAPNLKLIRTTALTQGEPIPSNIEAFMAAFKERDTKPKPDLSDLQNITTLSDLKQFKLCAQIRKYKEKLRKKKPNSPEKGYTIDIKSFKPIIYPNPDELGKYLGTRVISEFLTILKLEGLNDADPNKNFILQDFPYQICYMYNLTSLTFTGHDVLSIPDSIENLRSLEVLDLKNNKLISFPSGVAFLSKLYYLDLSDNFINEIPGDIYQILSARAPKFYQGTDITYHTIENTSETDFILQNIGGDITEQTNLKNIESKITNTTKVIVKLNLTDGQPPIDHTFLRLILDNSVGDDDGDKMPQDYIVRLLHKCKEKKLFIENKIFRSITSSSTGQLGDFFDKMKQETDFRKNYTLLNSLIADKEESNEIDYGINEDIPVINYVEGNYEIDAIIRSREFTNFNQYQIEYLSDFLKYCEIYDGEETDLNEIYSKYNEYQSKGNKFNFNQQSEETYNEVIRIYIMVAEKIKMIQSLDTDNTFLKDKLIYGVDEPNEENKRLFFLNDMNELKGSIACSAINLDTLKNLFAKWVNIYRKNLKITGSKIGIYQIPDTVTGGIEQVEITRDKIIYLLEELDDKISELREKEINSLISYIRPNYKTYMGEDMPKNIEINLRKEYIVDKILGHIIRNSDFNSITKYTNLDSYLEEETQDFLYHEDDKNNFNKSVMEELKRKLFIENADVKFESLGNFGIVKGDILKINVYYDNEGKICNQESNVTSKKLGDVLRFYKDLQNKEKRYGIEVANKQTFESTKLKQFLGIEEDRIIIPKNHLEILTKLQKNIKTLNQNDLSEIYKNLNITNGEQQTCLKNTLRIGMNMNIVEKQMGSTSDTDFINSFEKNRLFMAKNPRFDLLNVDIKIGINLYNTNNFINIINTQIVITYLYSLIRYNLKKGLNLITIGKYKFLFNKISGSSSGGGIKFLKGGADAGTNPDRMPIAFGGEVHRFNPLLDFNEIASEAQINQSNKEDKGKKAIKIKKLVSESFEGTLSEGTDKKNPEIKASSTKTVYGKPSDQPIIRKNAKRDKGKSKFKKPIENNFSITDIKDKIDTEITYNYNKKNNTLSIIYDGNDYGTVAIKEGEIYKQGDNLYLFRIESIDEDRMMCVPVLKEKLLQKKKPKFQKLPSNTYIEIVYHRIEEPTFGLSYPRFLKDEKYGTKTKEEAKRGIINIEELIMRVYEILNGTTVLPYEVRPSNDESAYSGYGKINKPVADDGPADADAGATVVGDGIYCTYFSRDGLLNKAIKPKSAQASPSAQQVQNAQIYPSIEEIYSGYSSLADNLYSKMSHTKNEEDVYSVYCAYKFEEIPRLLALIEEKIKQAPQNTPQTQDDQFKEALNNINYLINELVTPFVPKTPPVMPPNIQGDIGKSIEFLKGKMHSYMGLFIDHPEVGKKIEEQLKILSTELTEMDQFENIRRLRRSFYEYSVAVSPSSSVEIDIDDEDKYDKITENLVIDALSSPIYTTKKDAEAAGKSTYYQTDLDAKATRKLTYYQTDEDTADSAATKRTEYEVTDEDLMTNTAPTYSIIEPIEGEAGNLGIYCTIDDEIVTMPPKSN